jgi:N-carbamoylputrescine amidase
MAWQTVQRGHAVANGLPVITVNRVGEEEGIPFWGTSFVAAPDGYILHKNDVDFLGASIVEIDLAETEENRRWWPHFRNRRVDLYGDILKIWCKD